MASIHREIFVDAAPERGNGMVVRELIVDLDDEARRLTGSRRRPS